jgi:hypothetical protein
MLADSAWLASGFQDVWASDFASSLMQRRVATRLALAIASARSLHLSSFTFFELGPGAAVTGHLLTEAI